MSSHFGAKIRVAVVDDQPLFRAGVVHTLKTYKQVDVIAEGESASDALRIAKDLAVDVMLFDLKLRGGMIDAVEAITRLAPALRLVVLTGSEDEDHVAATLRSGARGYVLKDVSCADLFNAVRSVYAGDVYLTPSLGARLFARAATLAKKPEPPLVSDLTPREDQILAQVSNGSTNKEIARELDISEKTVKYYMTNIMQKLSVRNRVEAVVAARNRQQQKSA